MTPLEPASFEVERFELAGNACLEVRGRWFGVRGRRFMRPTLTAVTDGHEQRILAVLDHKPWNAEDGETWLAAFPCTADPAALVQAELTVAPGVTVPLPPPSMPATGRRPRRGAPRRSPPRPRDEKVKNDGSGRRSDQQPVDYDDDAAAADSRLRLEHDAALRSRDEAVSELQAARRECERLRGVRRQAFAAREAAIAERHESIEAEVAARIAELRAEAERERAGARLAAQTARERDEARTARDEAARERDEARAAHDDAQRARNRMLAERDTARTRVEEVARQWELTAGLGARRTLERDALAVERDRVTRDLGALAAERDRVARERDVALKALDAASEERESLMRDRDTALRACDLAAHERDAARADRDRLTREREATLKPREPESDEPTLVLTDREPLEPQAPPIVTERVPLVPRAQQTGHRHGASGTGSVPAAPGDLSDGPRDSTGVWRTRLLAVSGLLVAFVILLVLVLAK